MTLTAKLYAALGLILILIGTHWYAYNAGDRNGTNAIKVATLEASNKALITRIAENEAETKKQDKINFIIQKASNDELSQVRADLANAKRVRVGSNLCPPARASNTQSPGSSQETDPSGGLVSESTQQSINELIIKVEEGLAAGRACQAFVEQNGMN